MSKRIQSHPATASKSLFHQRLIKTLVMYALGEVQRSWDWLIESLELEEQKPKHKTSLKKKSKKEKKVPKTPVVTVKESSPVARVTRSSKRKLLLQQETKDLNKVFPVAKITRTQKKKQKTEVELDIQTQDELLVPKEEPEDCKEIHIRGSKKKKLKQSMQKQEEPVADDKGKKLSKTRKNKPVVNYPSRSKTRATNKLRLNSKALFNPSIKKENVIVIDDDTVESTEEEKGQSPVNSSHKWKKVKLEPKDEYYDDDTVEKQRKYEKGKQVAEHSMRHVTRATKKLSLKSKTLPKSFSEKGPFDRS
jgi:hypothetical protein